MIISRNIISRVSLIQARSFYENFTNGGYIRKYHLGCTIRCNFNFFTSTYFWNDPNLFIYLSRPSLSREIQQKRCRQHCRRPFKIKLAVKINPALISILLPFFFFFLNFFNNLVKFNQHPPIAGRRAKRMKKGGWLLSGRNSRQNVHRSELVSPPLRFSAANKLGCVTRPRFPLTTRFSETSSLPPSCPLSRAT